eukprot:s1_g2829.t1
MSEVSATPYGEALQARATKRRGRPLRNGPDRREDIIRASTLLFLKDGYTGTTLRRIAGAADVNVALVHYYFTSKQGLYQEVLNAALKTTLASLKGFQRAPSSVDEIARTLTAPLYEHPDLFQTLTSAEAPAEARDAAEAVMRRLSLSLTGCIRTLQQLGRIRRDLDPELFARTCLDLCWGPFRLERSGLHQDDALTPTPLSNGLLARHVEQNTLVLASAAASSAEAYHFTEKRGA